MNWQKIEIKFCKKLGNIITKGTKIEEIVEHFETCEICKKQLNYLKDEILKNTYGTLFLNFLKILKK